MVTLFAIMSVNAAMNLFGLLFEVSNSYLREAGSTEVDWQAFNYGGYAGLVPWICLLSSMFSSPYIKEIPLFVWGILFTYIFFFNTFPINMYLQYKQIGKWSDALYPDMRNGGYYYGEKVYQILSLAAKSVLIWWIVGGTAQPNSEISATQNDAPTLLQENEALL